MKEISFDTSSGTIKAACWDEVNDPIGTVQVAHGLGEYHGRYHELAERLNRKGYIVFCNDHLGHGLNVSKQNPKGYFGDEESFGDVVNHLAEMNSYIRKKYPAKKHFLVAHSLGTAISLSLLQRGLTFDGVVLSATFFVNPLLLFINGLLVGLEMRTLGPKGISKQMEDLTTVKHNSAFKPNRTTHDWLSTNEESVDAYVADPLCGFPNTVKLWQDLKIGFSGLWSKKSLKEIDENNRFLCLTGSQDSVNANGKQSEKIHNLLIDLGLESEFISYEGMRHEIFNELGRKKVFAQVLDFFEHSA